LEGFTVDRLYCFRKKTQRKIDRFSMDLLVRLAARAGLKPKLSLAA
jgi:hypothetical protein